MRFSENVTCTASFLKNIFRVFRCFYSCLFCYSCPNFPPSLSSSTQLTPLTRSQSPHRCPWVVHTCSLTGPSPFFPPFPLGMTGVFHLHRLPLSLVLTPVPLAPPLPERLVRTHSCRCLHPALFPCVWATAQTQLFWWEILGGGTSRRGPCSQKPP